MASKDCVSKEQLELPRYIAISYNLTAILIDTADSTTEADLSIAGCTAHAQIDASYDRSGLTLSMSAWDLDVHDDGSLHGVADLKVLAGENVMCSASIALVLTPDLGDAGAL